MLYPIGNVEDLQKLNELVSLENQVNVVRLQGKLGKQNFHDGMKKVFEPMTNVIKNTSEKITKTITVSSINKNKASKNSNEKVLELMDDKGMIAPYLASSLVNLLTPENKSHFELTKDQSPIRMINGCIPVSLYTNMLTFRDSNKYFKIEGDLLEKITNYDFKKPCYDFNVNHANPQDQKIIYEFGREMKFDVKQK